MSYKIRAVLLTFVLLLAIAASVSETTGAVLETKDPIGPEEYEVYAAVFASDKLDGIPYGRVTIERETLTENIDKENWKEVDGFMVEDFNRKNEKEYALRDKFPPGGKPDIKIRASVGKRGPFDFSGGGRTYVSRVGFNKANTEALVYVQHVADPEMGVGYYVFLHKKGGKWEVSGSAMGRMF